MIIIGFTWIHIFVVLSRNRLIRMNGVDPNDLVSPCRTEGLFLTILVFEPQPNTILMSIFATSDSKNMLHRSFTYAASLLSSLHFALQGGHISKVLYERLQTCGQAIVEP